MWYIIAPIFTSIGKIDIEVNINNILQSSAEVSILVRDSGIGIDIEKQQMIFNKFVQATDKIEKIYGGSGLGLSISIKLAELMGGTISLNSVLGVGSEFSLLLELVLA